MITERSQQKSRPKATLFCPSCGHEGHAISGWEQRDSAQSNTVHLYCPVCRAHVQSRGVQPTPVRPPEPGNSSGGSVSSPADD